MAGGDGLELEAIPLTATPTAYVHCMRKPPLTAPALQESLIRHLKLRWIGTAAPLGPTGFPVAYLNTLTQGDGEKAWEAIDAWRQKAPGAAFLVVVWAHAGNRNLRIYDLARHKKHTVQRIVPTTAKQDGAILGKLVIQLIA